MLIVPRSGPTDRQGNGPQGLRAASYRLLAEGLAARGIASARIDKRGMFGSASALRDANNVKIRDYAHDVTQWVTSIRQHTKANCIWVLGHSEVTSSRLWRAKTARGCADSSSSQHLGVPWAIVAGAVAGQSGKCSATESSLRRHRFAGSRSMCRDGNLTSSPAATFPACCAGLSIDPAHLVATARGPILILQGSLNLQAGLGDARRLHATCPQSKLVVLRAVNHALKSVSSDDRITNIESYGRADQAIASGVVNAIADFIATSPAR